MNDLQKRLSAFDEQLKNVSGGGPDIARNVILQSIAKSLIEISYYASQKHVREAHRGG